MAEITTRIVYLVVVLQIIPMFVAGRYLNFIIQNKKTGLVLESANGLRMNYWENSDSQLWNVIPSRRPGHFVILSVANRKAMTYHKNGIKYQKFKLNTNVETSIQVEHHPNVFLVGTEISFFGPKQSDDSDTWLVMPEVVSVEVA